MPAAVNSSASRVSGTKLGDAEKAAKECAEIEVELMELQAAYEQYFLGLERRPPSQKHSDLKKRMSALRNTFVNSTPVKFRVQNLQQRVNTFERLWERSLMEIENGTYKRDLFKARRHNEERKRRDRNGGQKSDGLDDLHIDEDLDLSDLDEGGDDLESAMAAAEQAVAKPAPAPAPGTIPAIKPLVPGVAPPAAAAKPTLTAAGLPAITAALPGATGNNPALKPTPSAPRPGTNPAMKAPGAPGAKPGAPARPPTPVGSDGGLNEQKIKAIYDAYLMAKKRCGEDTSKLSLDSVATTLRSQVPTLMKQHNAKSVEFKVVIKDGKAVLRALPKE